MIYASAAADMILGLRVALLPGADDRPAGLIVRTYLPDLGSTSLSQQAPLA